MTTAAKRQLLYDYIKYADDKKVGAIYNLVSDGINEKEIPLWQREETLRRLTKLTEDQESGIDWQAGLDRIDALCK